MHKQIRFQTSFRVAMITAIVAIIFGLFAITPMMAEDSNIKLSDIQIPEGDIVEYQISADSNYVVYLADQDTDEVLELYSVPTDGSTPPIKLNSTLPSGGNVMRYFQISADSTHVIYHADQNMDNVFELYYVPINGSNPPQKINHPLANGQDVGYEYLVSADGSWVVYSIDAEMIGSIALYSVPLDGSILPIQISTPLPSGQRLESFQINANSNKVVYSVDYDSSSNKVDELYSVAIDGSSAPIKLNQTLGSGSNIGRFQISPDGNHVVYTVTGGAVNLEVDIYSVPLDGSNSPIILNEPLGLGGYLEGFFKISADSRRVVYLSSYDYMSDLELYSMPIDGSAVPIILNESLVSGGNVWKFQISADSNHVVYHADQDTDDVLELYSVPIDGSTTATKLNIPVAGEGRVGAYEISSDSSQVVYTADEDDIRYELYSVPIDGSAASVKLNSPLVEYGRVKSFKISPDSNRVIYTAYQDTSSMFELYGAPISGNAPPIKLNGGLTSSGNVESFQISGDNNWIVYDADQDVDEMFELYASGGIKEEKYFQFLPIITSN